MAYADYSYYTDRYGGTVIPEAAFTRLALLAETQIDQMTFGRIKSDEPIAEAVKNAVCSVAEELSRQEQGPEKASESVGKQSVSYVASGKSNAQKCYDAAYPFLINTGLLYRGLPQEERRC
ncbi:hypothetical protein [Eubacterium sp.]|uniref:hypothetical protein n=1 Tax=Eubacterium sp. TaxID=142586 RepID=UPI0026E0FDE9|nr:hypothetical protein [Eubacterium sp.]MDO5433825.1 hypothetical protein [Eubacterium sp.]